MPLRARNWKPPALYPAGAHAWSGLATRVASPTQLLTPEAVDPAEYLNEVLAGLDETGLKGDQRAALTTMEGADTAGASVIGGLAGARMFGGFYFSHTADDNVYHARAGNHRAAYTDQKVEQLGAAVTAIWDLGNGEIHVYRDPASGSASCRITGGTRTNMITTIPTAKITAAGQTGTHVIVCSEDTGRKFYSYDMAAHTWALVTNPAATTFAAAIYYEATQKTLTQTSAAGPIAFVPRNFLLSAADWVYSTDATTLLKGTQTGIPNTEYYVGCAYDAPNDLWVMATCDNTAKAINLYTTAALGTAWTGPTNLLDGVTHSDEMTFNIVNGVYMVALGGDSLNTTFAYPSMYGKPGVTLLFSLDHGGTWEYSNAQLPVVATYANLKLVQSGDRVAVKNSKGLCMSGSLG